MDYKFNKINTACLFHDVNQWDEKITKNMCTFYAPFINAKYNGVIKDFTEDDIKAVAEMQYKKGLFSYENGWYGSHWVNAVIDYLKEVKWINCNLATCSNDKELKDWYDRWYGVILWIWVNSTFYYDKADGSLDLTDYSKYKWTANHFTNFIKWTCKWKYNCETNWKEMLLDSYFNWNSTYECNIEDLISSVDMPTKYIIF